MSSPGTEEAAGLNEPLLANGNNGVDEAEVAKRKGALKSKDDNWCWEDVGQPDDVAAPPDLENGDGRRPLLFRNRKVKNIVLYPFRALILIRIITLILFVGWRIKNSNSDVIWFWVMSIIADVWFGLSWLSYQLPKCNPIKSIPDLVTLRKHCDLPGGSFQLPGIDVIVTTASPIAEPILYTMNCVLSILAVDYHVGKFTCYLSDDSGSLILYEALVETAKFATLWVPFCRKHRIEPRAPESYFELHGSLYEGESLEVFMSDYKHVRTKYEEFKMYLDMLSDAIRERSNIYNRMETKKVDTKATWMDNGTQWPGTWFDPTENHRMGHHAGIVQIVQSHPNHMAQPGPQEANNYPLNFEDVDLRLPMLVYVAREKGSGCEHNKKAGALNAELRISALLSNAPFFINFDCDHYINNSQALLAAICFMLDRREGDNTGFVQFPQRFDNVDPTDRYGNHNRVFFDGAMYGLNGQQGPTYLGTGCMFRRLALYGIDPPCWRSKEIIINSNKFGNSLPFLNSVLAAIKQEQCVTPPLDDSFVAEMTRVVSSSYDDSTDWGRGVGYIYKMATEDIVTGFRIHGQGWRSMYCSMEREAFRGTAPINLTERLHQIVRWSGGSLEMFFSYMSPLFAGHRLNTMQRVSYINFTIYPITSLFILMYALCPVMWLLPTEIFIQRPYTRDHMVGLVAQRAVFYSQLSKCLSNGGVAHGGQSPYKERYKIQGH
ncbi:hypothetical protein BRADI_1g25150v3 [Brachypodium distachyon]|uniref:Uncharacterized protein n=1 Tax=Brachypodium distachyon TaxID=15368 RepID=A0A0Q3RS09_BRADI|nr:hypothetical protein BRADI_1g25150v3 [Brachypodium distachyon]